MVMFVLHVNGSDFFKFDIERKTFKVGEIIHHERLNGKFQVVHFDPATVTVRPA